MIFPFATQINAFLLQNEVPFLSNSLNSTITKIIDSGMLVPVLFIDQDHAIRICIAAQKTFCSDLAERTFNEQRTTFILNLFTHSTKDNFDPFRAISPICIDSWANDDSETFSYKIPHVTNLINSDSNETIEGIIMNQADFVDADIKPFAIITPDLVQFLINNPIDPTKPQETLKNVLEHFRRTGISRGPQGGKTVANLNGLQDIIKLLAFMHATNLIEDDDILQSHRKHFPSVAKPTVSFLL